MSSPPEEEEVDTLIADEGGLLHTGDSDMKEGALGSPGSWNPWASEPQRVYDVGFWGWGIGLYPKRALSLL